MTHFLYLVRHGEADAHDGPLSEAGKQQARLTGQRLSEVPFSVIHHGPLPRAAQTAGLIAACLPGVPVSACDLAGDYLPSDPDPAGGLPSGLASFIAGFSAAERAEGPALATAALERFARAGTEPDDTYELVVTHNFLIGWLVSQALDAPPWRWLGLNQMNCAVTVIAYLAGLPASLITFNDAGHLPPALRWTGSRPRSDLLVADHWLSQPYGKPALPRWPRWSTRRAWINRTCWSLFTAPYALHGAATEDPPPVLAGAHLQAHHPRNRQASPEAVSSTISWT